MLEVEFHAPPYSAQDAERLAAVWYGLRVAARELPGERDRNYHLRDDTGAEYVLKIANAEEQRATLDLQHALLAHLANRVPHLALQRVIPARTGSLIAEVTDDNGATHLVRMLTFVPGTLLAETRPHTPALLHSLGHLLGTIDTALLDFTHPAAHRSLKWDLAAAGWIRNYMHAVTNPTRRALVERLFTLYETEAMPRLPYLRSGVIYNDANDYNILVGGDLFERRVVSVIDWGDALHTRIVNELAIACAYAILDKPDPLAAMAHVVAGYHAALPLDDEELAALFPLICARLCVSVVNSAYQRQAVPANDYLTISERPAWDTLERLAAIHPRLAHYTLRATCSRPAVPHAPAVVHWLEANATAFAPVLAPDPRDAALTVLDLSIASLDLGGNHTFGDLASFTRTVFRQIDEAGAAIGIGRYNEARPIYTADQFRVAGNDMPEWRTIHVGLDLFAPPGTPVYAPLDGIVHSFADNRAPLDYGPTIILQHTAGDDHLTFYTLYGHLSRESLEGLQAGTPVTKGAQIGSIGDPSVNGGWPPHLHLQIITDMLDMQGDFPGVALPCQRDVQLSLSPDPNLLARIPAGRFPAAPSGPATILAIRREYIGPSLSISYRRPLTIVRGWMQHLYDIDGQAYLDAVNNVPHVGHCHPQVVRAGQRQMAVLNTNTRYLHENLTRFAERLCATLPAPLRVCYFVNSGSEATELALRLARVATGRTAMVVVDVGYHGNTTGAVEVSSYKFDGPGGTGPAPHIFKTPMPDLYRGLYRRDDPDAARKYAAHVAAALDQATARGGAAGFICESILSCGGQIVLPDGYLRAAYQHVRAAGGVCIADEVQTGFGRVGSHFWAFETQGVVPDIVTMGKPIGNGHPLGAVVTTPEIARAFNNGMEYFNTFGGNPVSCAIGMAVLDVIEQEGLQQHALITGARLLEGLRALMEHHSLIGDVRGLGLFLGIELVHDHDMRTPAAIEASYIANRMRDRGILLSTDGPDHNVLKIKPPLAFTVADADRLVATMDDVLHEI